MTGLSRRPAAAAPQRPDGVPGSPGVAVARSTLDGRPARRGASGHPRARQRPERARPGVGYLLDRVGLPAEAVGRFPHEMSGGPAPARRHRPGAGAGPQLLILDEAGLGPRRRRQAQVLNTAGRPPGGAGPRLPGSSATTSRWSTTSPTGRRDARRTPGRDRAGGRGSPGTRSIPTRRSSSARCPAIAIARAAGRRRARRPNDEVRPAGRGDALRAPLPPGDRAMPRAEASPLRAAGSGSLACHHVALAA